MTLGTGLAILGIWLFPSACAFAPTIKSYGFLLSVIVSLICTFLVLHSALNHA